MKNRYFKVEAKCGHVGKMNCIWIEFAVVAENGKEAAQKAKKYKRVKKQHKDVIQSVEEISFEEFMLLRAQNDADPYLHCKNIQEQRALANFDERVVVDEWNVERKSENRTKEKFSVYEAKKRRIAKKDSYKQMREYEEYVA